MSSPANSQKCGNPKCTAATGTAADSASPSSSSSPLQRCSRCQKTSYCSRDCQAAAWPQHKRSCKRPNYIIKFHVCPRDVTDPPVTRTLSCPADALFYHLHMALQVAFQWSTTHSFDFAVANPDYVLGGNDGRDYGSILEHINRLNPNRGPDPNDPQEYLARVVDPVEQTMFSGVDRMHEGARRHLNTVEKKADKYKLYQLLDDPKYQGKISPNQLIIGQRAPNTTDF